VGDPSREFQEQLAAETTSGEPDRFFNYVRKACNISQQGQTLFLLGRIRLVMGILVGSDRLEARRTQQ
jgi:hypothetical protein